MALYERITQAALPDFLALQTAQTKINYQHMQDLQEGLRLAINKNFTDIKRIFSGALIVGNAARLNGATLSFAAQEILQNDDLKIPTSMQVFDAIKIVIDNLAILDGVVVSIGEDIITINDSIDDMNIIINALNGSVVLLTGDQTIEGAKTFTGGTVMENTLNGVIPLTVNAIAGTLVYLQEWNVGGDNQASITAAGYLNAKGVNTPELNINSGGIITFDSLSITDFGGVGFISADAIAFQSNDTDIVFLSSGVISMSAADELSLSGGVGDVYVISPIRTSVGLFKTDVVDGDNTGFVFQTPEYIHNDALLFSIKNDTAEMVTIDFEGNINTVGDIRINGATVVTTIINDLITGGIGDALSAEQGKTLKGYIDSINTLLTSDNISLDSLQEIVDYIEANNATLTSLDITSILGLQTALDGKVDDGQVLTDVPLGALFTDTVYTLTQAKIEAAITSTFTMPEDINMDGNSILNVAVIDGHPITIGGWTDVETVYFGSHMMIADGYDFYKVTEDLNFILAAGKRLTVNGNYVYDEANPSPDTNTWRDIASESEAIEGTNNTKTMTPLRTLDEINEFAYPKTIKGVMSTILIDYAATDPRVTKSSNGWIVDLTGLEDQETWIRIDTDDTEPNWNKEEIVRVVSDNRQIYHIHLYQPTAIDPSRPVIFEFGGGFGANNNDAASEIYSFNLTEKGPLLVYNFVVLLLGGGAIGKSFGGYLLSSTKEIKDATITNSLPGNVPLKIEAVVGTSANLQTWAVGGVNKALIDKDGNYRLLNELDDTSIYFSKKGNSTEGILVIDPTKVEYNSSFDFVNTKSGMTLDFSSVPIGSTLKMFVYFPYYDKYATELMACTSENNGIDIFLNDYIVLNEAFEKYDSNYMSISFEVTEALDAFEWRYGYIFMSLPQAEKDTLIAYYNSYGTTAYWYGGDDVPLLPLMTPSIERSLKFDITNENFEFNSPLKVIGDLNFTGDIYQDGVLFTAGGDPLTTVLTGLDASTGGTLIATDTILAAFGKLENRVALNDAKSGGTGTVHDTPVNGEITAAISSNWAFDHINDADVHAISAVVGLQTALDNKVDDGQVLTNVPAGALFTDTVYTLPSTAGLVIRAEDYFDVDYAGRHFIDLTPYSDGVLAFTINAAEPLEDIYFYGDSSWIYTIRILSNNATTGDKGFVLLNPNTGIMETIKFRDLATQSVLLVRPRFGYPNAGAVYTNFSCAVLVSWDTVYTLPFADNSANWNTAFGWGDHSTLYALTGDVLTPVPAGALFTDTITTVINDLVTGGATDALSAAQGVTLKGYIDTINTLLGSDETTLDTLQEVVDYIETNRATLDALGISGITGLQDALDAKVDDGQVLTNVPAGALFTDTVYSLTEAAMEAALTNITFADGEISLFKVILSQFWSPSLNGSIYFDDDQIHLEGTTYFYNDATVTKDGLTGNSIPLFFENNINSKPLQRIVDDLTWDGNIIYNAGNLKDLVVTNTLIGVVPLTVDALASTTYIQRWKYDGTLVASLDRYAQMIVNYSIETEHFISKHHGDSSAMGYGGGLTIGGYDGVLDASRYLTMGYDFTEDIAYIESENNDGRTQSIVIKRNYGNVGIGQVDPQYKLDVLGDINFTGDFRKGGVIINTTDHVGLYALTGQVLTDVPAGALFTDTIYTLTELEIETALTNVTFADAEISLNKVSIGAMYITKDVDDKLVIDTDRADMQITCGTLNIGGALTINDATLDSLYAATGDVLTPVPAGALFTDTIYTLDKAAVETVLIGEISTHSHANSGGGATVWEVIPDTGTSQVGYRYYKVCDVDATEIQKHGLLDFLVKTNSPDSDPGSFYFVRYSIQIYDHGGTDYADPDHVQFTITRLSNDDVSLDGFYISFTGTTWTLYYKVWDAIDYLQATAIYNGDVVITTISDTFVTTTAGLTSKTIDLPDATAFPSYSLTNLDIPESDNSEAGFVFAIGANYIDVDYVDLSLLYRPIGYTPSQAEIETVLIGEITTHTHPSGVVSFNEITITSDDIASVPLIVDGFVGQTSNLQEWKVNGSIVAYLQDNGDFNTSRIKGTVGQNYADIRLGTTGVLIGAGLPAVVGLTVENAHASLTANLQNWKNNSGIVAFVDKDGNFDIKGDFYKDGVLFSGGSSTVHDTPVDNDVAAAISSNWAFDHMAASNPHSISLSGLGYTGDVNANEYTHPANHSPSIIAQDLNNRFVTDLEKTNWNNAFGWGDHDGLYSLVGHDHSGVYLESETSHADVLIDGDFLSEGLIKRGATSGTYSIVTDNSANWNTAFGWGDHSGLYLTSVAFADLTLTPTTLAGYGITDSIILEGDARLTDARNAADVSAWAKAASKPTYDYSELSNPPTIPTLPTSHEIAFVTGLQTALNNKVDDGQVLTNVPAGALFTDTVYTLDKAKVEAVLTGEISTHTHAGGGTVDLKPASFYSTVALPFLLNTPFTLPISTTAVSNSNYSLASYQVTVTDAGTYQIMYSVTTIIASTAGGTRTRTQAWVEADTVAIPQSYSAVYHREAAEGSGMSASFIVTLSAGDVLRLRGNNTYLNTDIDTERVSFSIMKLA